MCSLVIATVEHVAAELETGILTEDFAFERHELQPADIHKVIVVVVADVASVPVKDAAVIRQQILLLGPNAGEWFSPELNADLPLRRDRTRRQTALDDV